jgi:ribosomal protein S18 acetylase RimI-like enzyme
VNEIIAVGDLTVKAIDDHQLGATREVYRQCEDFLALGPAPAASLDMFVADIQHSREADAIYCGIWRGNTQVGVLDFIPEAEPKTAEILLLMIARPYRSQGFGSAILEGLIRHLGETYDTRTVTGGVQINNPSAIAFWRRHGFEIGSEARDCGDGTTAYPMDRRIPAR